MNDGLDLPDELKALMEKRESGDRRTEQRRQADLGPPGEERRSGDDRRETDRRAEEEEG